MLNKHPEVLRELRRYTANDFKTGGIKAALAEGLNGGNHVSPRLYEKFMIDIGTDEEGRFNTVLLAGVCAQHYHDRIGERA